jgi:hypothetical protein
MAIESDADRLVFLSSDDFGTAITVGASTIYGVMDKEYTAVQQGDIAVESDSPVAVVRASDVTAQSIAVGTSLTISSATYVVVSVQPDGTGMTRLVLRDNA